MRREGEREVRMKKGASESSPDLGWVGQRECGRMRGSEG